MIVPQNVLSFSIPASVMDYDLRREFCTAKLEFCWRISRAFTRKMSLFATAKMHPIEQLELI
jgi:hypothetical protein